ncbi:MAG: alpha/beta hydrolase [Nocardioides sp.]|uniref:alpha/beta hydrolase n=1 Tax=Nocardioides sp. TaxID=35761 RepID=UPI0039E28CFC
MRLFPAARAAVEADAAAPRPWELDIDEQRAGARRVAAVQPRPDVAEVSDHDADGVAVRLYVPHAARDGVIVHLHGGGFVFGDIEVHDAAARELAETTRIRVLSVDYRRPPEHRFPAAPDDVDTVLAWLAAQPGIGTMPVYAHGDSAGGSLALVAALRNPGRFRAVALVYPFLDPSCASASYRIEGGWAEEARWYWEQYAASPADHADPDLAPLLAGDDRLARLPPTLVVSAEGDILVDEDEELAHRLADLGVEVVAFRAVGQVHGFWRHSSVFSAVGPVMAMTAAFLSRQG